MIYYIYIVECIGDKLYTGIATDYKRRFEEHKAVIDDVKELYNLYQYYHLIF